MPSLRGIHNRIITLQGLPIRFKLRHTIIHIGILVSPATDLRHPAKIRRRESSKRRRPLLLSELVRHSDRGAVGDGRARKFRHRLRERVHRSGRHVCVYDEIDTRVDGEAPAGGVRDGRFGRCAEGRGYGDPVGYGEGAGAARANVWVRDEGLLAGFGTWLVQCDGAFTGVEVVAVISLWDQSAAGFCGPRFIWELALMYSLRLRVCKHLEIT